VKETLPPPFEQLSRCPNHPFSFPSSPSGLASYPKVRLLSPLANSSLPVSLNTPLQWKVSFFGTSFPTKNSCFPPSRMLLPINRQTASFPFPPSPGIRIVFCPTSPPFPLVMISVAKSPRNAKVVFFAPQFRVPPSSTAVAFQRTLPDLFPFSFKRCFPARRVACMSLAEWKPVASFKAPVLRLPRKRPPGQSLKTFILNIIYVRRFPFPSPYWQHSSGTPADRPLPAVGVSKIWSKRFSLSLRCPVRPARPRSASPA